ncbi:unnamed protein product [Nesidiocoris tenuis]|uniref:EGF-like domain-containing protein n=1 Tax=Nesidiocoris tenuis TaxID=355587 RepID=A0A6H5HUM7_9HEMI|nr:unnamed protein product [Nesidiocoris tenuis]
MARTNKRHFGGGDTAYEEEKLGDYAVSEVRLAEVQEGLCADVKRGQNQCFKLAELWESNFEDWWPKQKEIEDLYDWLCVRTLSYCCPEGHYGAECRPCPGHPGPICSNNGKCKGAGTRKGNGLCACNIGYEGELCDKCTSGYYDVYRDEKTLLCSKCHKSCKGPCTKAGPKGCVECNVGWLSASAELGGGCLDVNECARAAPPCTKDEFCVNNEGSYACLQCDRSCDGCTGDGPDMCVKCAEGHKLEGNGPAGRLCVPVGRPAGHGPPDWSRYLTYLGLSVATGIIFQKNTTVAAVIGLLVGLYVTVSEYMLSSPSPDHNHALQNSLNALFNNKLD